MYLKDYYRDDGARTLCHLVKEKDGKPSPKVVIRKQIDETYYIIETASDAKAKRNYIVSVYIKKRTI